MRIAAFCAGLWANQAFHCVLDLVPVKPSKPAIRATAVSLDLPLLGDKVQETERGGSRSVGGRLTRLIGSRGQVRALDSISFELNHGDRVGIIGRNGAGKSTLLRLIAGIYQPSAGTLAVEGRLSTLFTNRIGLNERATGRENIRLAGHLLGMSSAQIETLLPEIAAFSELEDFIDLPLRTYSSGMSVRLGFAIATALDPDILLIDEVFGAGDRSFQNKAQERVRRLIEDAGTLVLASHSSALLRRFCSSIIWLDHGELKAFGSTDAVLAEYELSIASKQTTA
ncbi:ABC transporter ATP-binding protein [Limibacillus sp. MBR-115]|uniref:ABC transporter ATP-binding protein n=1 Tax=Limibacillus sp. MBR-115 TaxID=3156465 RepID=UPI00339AE8C2